ncbi:MurR/RpiR family transcriptional regulator [Piscinibacter sakaiensis]|uniref:MurR/RpiR family transcriptional regulator n=1 Tax=Piscinibacter sakaiensis TaxID=1547922 RepID=UPI003AAC25E4
MIADRFESLSPELKRAASWVAMHGSALALHSMRDSARAADVTPATMTRLARRLGFDGFEGLRAPFRRELAGNGSGAEFERMLQLRRGSTPLDEVVSSLNSLQQGNVASVLARNRSEQIEAAAREIIEANQVCFLGLRVCYGVATYLSYAYGLLRPNGQLVTGIGGMMSDQIARFAAGDVMLAVSQAPYTRQTVEGVVQAADNGAKVIALTDSKLSPLARAATHVLLYDTASSTHFHSTAGAQALAEALIAAVAARGGAQAMTHLRRVRKHLRDSGAYWDRVSNKE